MPVKDKKKNRYLSLEQMIDLGVMDFRFDHQFKKANLFIEDNTPDEILSAVVEFEKRNNKEWKESEEYRKLHNLFYLVVAYQ